MKTELLVTVKHVYGVQQLYPANEQARLVCKLLGQKTLTRENCAILKQMGFDLQPRADLTII